MAVRMVCGVLYQWFAPKRVPMYVTTSNQPNSWRCCTRPAPAYGRPNHHLFRRRAIAACSELILMRYLPLVSDKNLFHVHSLAAECLPLCLCLFLAALCLTQHSKPHRPQHNLPVVVDSKLADRCCSHPGNHLINPYQTFLPEGALNLRHGPFNLSHAPFYSNTHLARSFFISACPRLYCCVY